MARPLPQNQLNPKIKSVWRISAIIWCIVIAVCILLPCGAVAGATDHPFMWLTTAIVAIVVIVIFVLTVIILPPIRYIRWRYEVTNDYLDIAKGIIWRNRYVIPFIRVQNTDTRQGPILRAFGLASVTVSTAAGEHVIAGLAVPEAEELRDRAAELARIAREDV